MNGDQKALKLLQAMGKQGNLVTNYDGTGGQTVLDIWSEGLYRHFKLFEIEDSESEVTLAACFLKGRAKEWWEKMCHTKQHLEIRNLPNFIEALNHEFRPLNEDLRLTNQWKMLTQRGDLNTFKMEVTKLRGQFPFDEAAEFHLTFHALKRELRGPILNELWRREVRHLKIDDLFKLAGQAESTWLFSSPNRNLDQGRNQNSRNFNRNGGRYDFPRQLSWNDRDRRDNWPPMTRPPIQVQTTTSTRNNFGRNTNTKPNNDSRRNTNGIKRYSADQVAWLKKRPYWVCDKTGHTVVECPKKHSTGCLRCGKDHRLRDCPQRPNKTIGCVELQDENATTDEEELRQTEEQEQIMELAEEMGAVLAVRKKLEGITLQFTVRIHDKPLKAIIDTGAQLSLISKRETDRLRIRVSRNDGDSIIYGVSGYALQVLGKALVYMTNGKETK